MPALPRTVSHSLVVHSAFVDPMKRSMSWLNSSW
jgi:hypothetical protein